MDWRGGGGEERMLLKGKRVIALGERDGVNSEAIAACAAAAGAEVVFAIPECFV